MPTYKRKQVQIRLPEELIERLKGKLLTTEGGKFAIGSLSVYMENLIREDLDPQPLDIAKFLGIPDPGKEPKAQ